MKDWLELLAQGAVSCRAMQGKNLIREFTPNRIEQLWVPIFIPDLGETAHGNFTDAYRQFVESGQTEARHECVAGKTITKFGQAIQFEASFTIEFKEQS